MSFGRSFSLPSRTARRMSSFDNLGCAGLAPVRAAAFGSPAAWVRGLETCGAGAGLAGAGFKVTRTVLLAAFSIFPLVPT